MSDFELSPLNVLLRQRDKADTALTDALVLTFNHDLSFFEREALGLLQLTGARLTVVGDARATGHDLYAVRHAGTSYLPGLASCAGAFHPKLVALVGADDVTVAVGSGNLTLAGWRGNDELWSVHHAWAGGGSVVPSQVGEFLGLLPGIVRVVPSVAEVLLRVGEALAEFPGVSTDHTVVSSLTQPIIEQLPLGPVDELNLYAPFHDQHGAAVRALLERFEPKAVYVAYQPESTNMPGAAITELLGTRGELFAVADTPYRHGKLIEWRRGDSRWALTGSPNLSVSALLRTADSGGNVELGIISPITVSLMPARLEDTDIVLSMPMFGRSADRTHARDVILAAIVDEVGVVVTTARPLATAASLEYSLPEDPPERWRDADQLSIGATEHLVQQPLPSGTRVRLAYPDGTSSPVVFVTSLAAVNRVRAARRLGPPMPEIGDVLGDPETAEKFWTILSAASSRVAAPRGVPRSGSSQVIDADRSTVVGDWSAYLDRCKGELGSRLLSFALGLPEIEVGAPADRRVIDWDADGDIEDEVGALDDDEASTVLPDPPESLLSVKDRLTEEMRAKYRTFAERRAADVASAEPHEALIALRLLLLLGAGDVWKTADLSWTEFVLQAVRALEPCEGEELESAAGSLAAVALAVVDFKYATSTTTVGRGNFHKSTAKVAHLLVMADDDRIEEYSKGLNRFAHCLESAEVLRLRDLLVNDDPLEHALMALDDAGIGYTRSGPMLLLDEATSNPLQRARSVWDMATRLDHVAVRAPGKMTGQWATVVGDGPDRIEIRPGGLPGSLLVTHLRRLDGKWTTIAETHAKQPFPPEGLEVLKRLGLSPNNLDSR